MSPTQLCADGAVLLRGELQEPLKMLGEERLWRMDCDDVFALLFLAMFCALAYVVGYNKYFLIYRLRDFFSSKRTYSGDNKDVNRSEVGTTIILVGITCMSLSMMILERLGAGAEVQCMEVTSMRMRLLVVFGALALLLLAKSVVYMFVNWVFFRKDENAKWMSSFLFLCSFVSLLLYPLSLVDVYSAVDDSVVTYCLLTILVLYEFSLFYRLCVNFRVKKASCLLFFLYFCSAEIMPLLVLWRYSLN